MVNGDCSYRSVLSTTISASKSEAKKSLGNCSKERTLQDFGHFFGFPRGCPIEDHSNGSKLAMMFAPSHNWIQLVHVPSELFFP
jgi:hypothetical protein